MVGYAIGGLRFEMEYVNASPGSAESTLGNTTSAAALTVQLAHTEPDVDGHVPGRVGADPDGWRFALRQLTMDPTDGGR